MNQPHDPVPLHVAELERLDRRRRELLAEIRERLATLDPDPLHVAELEADAWEAGYAAAEGDRAWRVAGLVLAALSGAIVGAALMYGIVTAASRSAQEGYDPARAGAPLDARETPSWAAEAAAGTAVARSERRPDPAPAATDETESPALPEPSSITGIASYVGAFLGDRYLALPEGRGVRVRICAASISRLCLERISTDAGPDLAMQRAGRIADVSFVDFAVLCRCHPPNVGLVRVTVTRLDAAVTPPPTESEP